MHFKYRTYLSVFVSLLIISLFCESCKKTTASSGNSNPNPSSVTVSTIASSSSQSVFNAGPHGICVDDKGNIFFSTDLYTILEINPLGLISTFAGSSSPGCEAGNGTSATFTSPLDICIDASDNIYVADLDCTGVKQVSGSANSVLFCKSDAVDGINLYALTAIGVDSKGNVYTGGETGAEGITMINPQGKGFPVAGDGNHGFKDGPAASAEFAGISGIVIDDNGDVYIADGTRIRKISQGQVTTIAGNGQAGYADGNGTSAEFGGAMGICLDSKGNIFVADPYNQVIREVTAGGAVTTVAGSPEVQGYKDGSGNQAEFDSPVHLCFDAMGNLLVSDLGTAGDLDFSGHIRKITFK
jgi:serine/threonine-protein kinase